VTSTAARPTVSTTAVAVGLAGAALVTWIVVVDRMQGMDGGPGTDLGGLGWYVGVWVTMMAAMMLPSAMPMVLLFARVYAGRAAKGGPFVPTWIFVAGYLATWTGFGLVAYGLYRAVRSADLGFLAWDAQGPYVAGGAVAVAGIYELTPLKRVCLRHCRGPMHFLMHDWREGRVGALRMGIEHGAWCAGCCVGLMVVLFAVGVMSILWMAVIAAVVFVEKILPIGEALTRVLAVALVAAGIWIAVAPGSVPGLTQPGSSPMGQMGGGDRGQMNDGNQTGGGGNQMNGGMDTP
jgi:predicted metal-binding membrane protein